MNLLKKLTWGQLIVFLIAISGIFVYICYAYIYDNLVFTYDTDNDSLPVDVFLIGMWFLISISYLIIVITFLICKLWESPVFNTKNNIL